MSIQKIASKGRYGDNHLLHVSDAEVQGLNAIANQIYGHGLTTNPETGLPEAFLFAPLLAPMLAGSVGTGLGLAGGSALATGLTAGGLGAAEAAARGMDDPLGQGLMAGLTAGALQGAGNAFSSMGADAAGQAAVAGQGAGQAAVAGGDTFSQVGMSPTEVADVYGSSAMGVDPFTTHGMSPSQYSQTYGTGAMQAPTANLPTQPSAMDSAMQSYMPSDQTMAGARKAFGSQEGFKEFLDKGGSMSLAAGATGLAGQEALDQQAKQKQGVRDQEAKKQAKYDEMVNRIKSNYASAGRDLPTNPYGPLFGGPKAFAEGKKVEAEKSFPDYQPEGTLKGTIFDYIPDAQQVSRWLQDQLPEKYRMPKKTDKRAGGGYLEGGIASLKGDGMSDSVPAEIDGSQPAALSTGEYVIPADVVSHLGNGSSDDGAVRLDEMLDRVRMARTGTQEQAPQIKSDKYLPA